MPQQLKHILSLIKNEPRYIYTLVQLCSAGVAFLALPILTRRYPAEVYGQYLLIVSSVVMLTAFATNWLQQGILRILPGSGTAQHIKAQIINFSYLITGVAVCCSVFFIPLFQSVAFHGTLLLLIVLYVALSVLVSIHAVIRQAEERGFSFAAYMFFQGFVPPVLSVAFSYVSLSVESLMLSLVIGLAMALLFVFNVHKVVRPDIIFLREMLHYGFPLSVWVISAQVLNSLDRFMLSFYFDTSVAGIYAVNYTIIVALQSLLFSPLLLSAHPQLMRLWNSGEPAYITMLHQAILRFLIIAMCILGFFWSTHQTLGMLMLGEEFQRGTFIMPIISAGHILWGLASYLHKELEFQKQTWRMGAFALVAVAVNVGLNIVFMPHYGMEAAAWTTFAAYATYIGLIWLVSTNHILVMREKPLALLALLSSGGILAANAAIVRVATPPPLLHLFFVGLITLVAMGLLFVLQRRFFIPSSPAHSQVVPGVELSQLDKA